MPTPKSKRAAPAKRLNDYVVQKIVPNFGGGLSKVPEDKFTVISGTEYNPAAPSTYWQTISSVVQLGFSVEIDGTKHETAQVSPCGWMVLNDASIGSVTLSDLGLSSGYDTYSFNVSGGQHLILSPWGSRLRGIQSAYTASNPIATRINYGYETPPIHFGYNERVYGVQYCRENNNKFGKRFIVRWNTLTDVDSNLDMRVAKFECVIYESGRIEFNYDTKSNQLSLFSDVSSGAANFAVVGVFASGTVSSPQFRDLSIYTNYDVTRSMYPLGGTVYDVSYSDAGSNFSRLLTYANNWTPGTLVLNPPANRRKILRNFYSNLESQGHVPGPKTLEKKNEQTTFFRDNDVPTYTTQSIDLMLGMPRFFADGTQDAQARHDVFGTISSLTASRVMCKNASDSFLIKSFNSTIDAFNDENTTDPSSTFALSGSDHSFYDGILTGELRQKKQINVEFQIDYHTQLFGTSASIHYFDPTSKMWRMPPNTTSVSTSTSSLNANSDIEDFLGHDSFQYYSDYDTRGFDATGQFYLSMSEDRRDAITTDSTITDFTQQNISKMLQTSSIDNAITTSPRYDAETAYFELPISQPFLLEKMSLTLPIEAGPGWFGDITATGRRTSTSFVRDRGGPAMTVALMHEQKNSRISRRNIIMSGTITHTFDNIKSLEVLSATPSVSSSIILSGFRHHGIPTSVVNVASSSSFFTGSVTLQMEAATSAGIVVYFQYSYSSTPINTLLSSSYAKPFVLFNSNPLGRSKTGFDVDMSSPYGKEHVGLNSTYLNPFSPLNGTDVSAVEAVRAVSGSSMLYIATGLVSNTTYKQSPYLIRPGDKLVLAISKGRPWYSPNTTYSTPSRFSAHDIKLATGKIKARFFGTQLKNEKELLTNSDQLLQTNAIHEVIGNDNVIDEYVGTYKELYEGTYTDNYVTGSLVYKQGFGNEQLVTGSRGRWFSKVNVHGTIQETSSSLNKYDINTQVTTGTYPPRITLSSISQPLYQIAGSPRVLSLKSDNERYYDSMPPSFTDCTTINGGKIISSSALGLTVLLDYIGLGTGSTSNPYPIDYDWLRTFPTEPRYANVKRIKQQKQRYVSKVTFSGSFIVEIPAKNSEELRIVVGQPVNSAIVAPLSLYDCAGFYEPGVFGGSEVAIAPNSNDVAKMIYGFGDRNNIHAVSSSTYGIHGVHNLCDFQLMTGSVFLGTQPSGVNPVVRGWRYGLLSPFPLFSKAYWRIDRYGQFRDMLEQRDNTKFFNEKNENLETSPIKITFVDVNGKLTAPENTLSQNLSYEATSSAPYTDGIAVQRTDINTNTVNKGIVTLKTNEFGNPVF